MAITPEQIIETAEALTERGESPTLAAVRRELGGGSFTTISEALKGWREKRQAGQRVEAVQVPARVQEALAAAGAVVWTEATKLHAAQLAAEREALDLERQRNEGERREAVELADQVTRELDQVKRERDELRGQAAETGAELGNLRGRLDAAQAQVADLRETVGRIEGERDQAREATQAAQGEAREAVGRLQEQAALLKALRAQVGEGELAAVRLTAERDRARQEAAEAERRATTADTQADHAAQALESAQGAQNSAERAAEAIRLELATLTERAAQQAAQLADLRALFAAAGKAPEAALELLAVNVPEALPVPTPEATTTKRPTRRRPAPAA